MDYSDMTESDFELWVEGGVKLLTDIFIRNFIKNSIKPIQDMTFLPESMVKDNLVLVSNLYYKKYYDLFLKAVVKVLNKICLESPNLDPEEAISLAFIQNPMLVNDFSKTDLKLISFLTIYNNKRHK